MIDNQYYVIDAHCHIYPEKIAEKAVAGTDRFYGFGKSVYDGTVETLLKQGQKAGIDHFIVQSVATTPKQVPSINEFIAGCVAQSGGKMTGLGTLHPDCTDMSGEIERILSLGLRGVKLHPDIQQFPIDDPRCCRIYELCEQNSLPILMHTGDNRYDYSNPNRLRPVLKHYEGLILVGAHLGGYSVWDEAVERLADLPNLFVDCSSSFAFLDDGRVRRIIEAYGVHKVMFATDYPMWSAERELKTLMSLGFSQQEYRMMLSENAKKIFLEPKR